MDVIVYRTRRMTPVVVREVDRLRRELPGVSVAIVAYQAGYLSKDSDEKSNLYLFGADDLRSLPYPTKKENVNWHNPIGHHDLPVLAYYLTHPNFDRYWVIEDDVRCSSPWAEIVDELGVSTADLLMTVIQNFSENPGWQWWNTLATPGKVIDPDFKVKGFGPFCRLSAKCLAAIHARYQAGWGGHFEVAWPVICCDEGLTFEDVGGLGRYTPPKRRGKFYTNDANAWHLFPGSFVYRPAFLENGTSEFAKGFFNRPILWHPVKS
jgi:hypothetical protein